MSSNRYNKKILFYFLTSFIITLDQISKVIISKTVTYGTILVIIPRILDFTVVYNYGAAFSILNQQTFILKYISLIASTLLAIVLFSKNNKTILEYLGLAFLLGGTVGNGIDRWLYGYVIDFIELKFINFPIFNLADISINFGVVFFIINFLYNKYLNNSRSNTFLTREKRGKI